MTGTPPGVVATEDPAPASPGHRAARAGQTVTLWIDTTSVHLSAGGWRVKTVHSRLSGVDLARLRNADARPAGPPPAGPWHLAAPGPSADPPV